jgi:hypothetical protein
MQLLFNWLGHGLPFLKATAGDFGIDPVLTLLSALLDANKLCASFRQSEWANARRPGQAVHGCIDRRDRHGCTRAAIHLLVEMTEDNAGSGQKTWADAHDFGDGDFDIAVSDYGARADNHSGSNQTGFKAPASETQSG